MNGSIPRRRQWLWMAGLCAAVALASARPADAQRPGLETPATRAAKLYREALSQMHVRQFQQAADLFNQLIRQYGTNEVIPAAQLYLAGCLDAQKLDKEYVDQLDLCIRTYAGTEVELIAISRKLVYYTGKKDAAGYLAALKELTGPAGDQPIPEYLIAPAQTYYSNGQLGIYPAWQWEQGLTRLCTTPALAGEALAALAATFKQGPAALPLDWQWLHVQLLRAAGREADAEKAFGQYVTYWDKDVRGCRLWWLYAEAGVQRKKDDEAVKAWETICRQWPGTQAAGAGAAGYQLLFRLAAKEGAEKEFVAAAEEMMKRYRLTTYAAQAKAMLGRKLAAMAAAGDVAAAERAYELIGEGIDDRTPPDRSARIEEQFRLAVSLKDDKKAATLAAELLGEKLWSPEIYARVEKMAADNEALKPAVAAAAKRCQIAPARPDGESAKLLAQLKTRIKDDQMRFAEEVAEEMFSKHTADAETIEAVATLAEHYFRQVMPEERDKWMGRMMQTYPTHPRTEAVLNFRCAADRAAADYDALARDSDLAIERFGASRLRAGWVQMRQQAYRAAKDEAGLFKLLERDVGPDARRGNILAIRQLIAAEPMPADADKNATIAQRYLNWADRLEQTHPALDCLAQARNIFYQTRDYAKAQEVSKRLRTQQIDPQTAWQYRYDDIRLFLLAGQHAEAIKAANERLAGEAHPRFRTTRRLGLSELGTSFGEANDLAGGKALAARLAKLYDAPQDIDAIDLMLANMYIAATKGSPSPEAAAHLTNVVNRITPRDLAYSFYLTASRQATDDPNKYGAAVQEYLRTIPRAHHLRPTIIEALGGYYLSKRNPRAAAIQGQLTRDYPASRARDSFDARINPTRRRR